MTIRIFMIAILILLASMLKAQDGVQFQEISFEEALSVAKAQEKVVFIDGFASWCGPCKRMDMTTFKDESVGSFYNDNFVSIKLDMEKEGKEVAEKYNVKAYPTFLYLDGEGKLLHKGAGYYEPDQFLELAETSSDEKNRLGTLQERFDRGDREPDMLRTLLEQKFELLDPTYIHQAEALAHLYDDWNSEDVRSLIFKYTNSAVSPLYTHLVKNKKDYEVQFGKGSVWNKIETLLQDRSFEIEHTSIEEMSDLFALVYPSQAKKMSSKYRMSYYRQKGDRLNYAISAIDHYDQYPSKDAEELNEVGSTFSRVIDDKKLLKEAIKLVDKSIKIDDAYYNNDTRAALLFKMGEVSKAKLAAEKAIHLADQVGEDASYTKELLEVILSHEAE